MPGLGKVPGKPLLCATVGVGGGGRKGPDMKQDSEVLGGISDWKDTKML